MDGTAEEPGRADPLSAALVDIVRLTGASAGAVYLRDPAEPVLRLTVVCGIPAAFIEPWKRVPLAAPFPVTDAVRGDRLVWMGDAAALSRTYPRAAIALPYRFALAAVPIGGAGHCWGALLLLWPAGHPLHLTGRQRGHLTSSSRRIAVLLAETARTRRPTPPDEPRVVDLRAPRLPPALSSAAADFAERLPGGSLALDLEGRITFVTAGAAELLGREADRLLGTRPWQSLPWLDDPVYEDRYREAVISRAPTSYSALRPPGERLDFHLYPDSSGISVRIVPSEQERPPALRASAAPARASLHEVGRLHQLMHLSAALTEAVGVQDVVDLIGDQIVPAFGAQGLALYTADAGRLRMVGHRGYPARAVERLDALPLDTDLTPVGRALADGVPSFYSTAGEMALLYPQAPAISGKQAWAVLPLVAFGRPIGCCVLSYDAPHAFTADERAVLTSLGGLMAQALDRARLYDAKHDLAHGLQQALLPKALPAVPGLDVAARYLPASHGMDIGGDFYDLIRLTDTTCAALIGDVQGHNVAAAALMGQVRTAVHAYAADTADPGEVLLRTNRVMADLDPDLLVSCLYAHLDLARHRLSLASAGHPPPLVRHPGRPAERLEVEPGLLLGVTADADYPVTRLALPGGALLALYTDGLVETPGTDPDEVTERLLHHLVRAGDDAPEALIDGLIARARPAGQHTDDTAVLLLRLRAR